MGAAVATSIEATRRSAAGAPDARNLLTEADLTMRSVRLPLILVTAAALVAALAAFASRCGDTGDSGEPKVVLTAADVQKAFADQGLDLAAYEIGPGIPALGYPCAGCGGVRVVCEIYSFPVVARGVVTTMRKKLSREGYRAVRAKNVAVLTVPEATPEEVQRTLRAVVELRHE
jgi:hypothetical protein